VAICCRWLVGGKRLQLQLNGNQPLKIAAQPPSTPSAAGTKASGCTCCSAYLNSSIQLINSYKQLACAAGTMLYAHVKV